MLPEKWRRHPIAGLVAASAGATIATAPITAFVFGSVAPVGVLANLTAVPLSSLAVPAVFASLGAGWMAGGAGLALAGIERTAQLATSVPGGTLTGPPGWRFALPFAAVLALLFWAMRRRPPWVLARRRLLLGAAAAAWAVVVIPALPRSAGQGLLEIHFLDVGQGDAIALRTPQGHWALIDAGPRTATWDAGRSVVLPFFRRRGVRRIQVLIASHGDADHLGGAPAVMAALSPELVLEPGQPLGSHLYLEHLSLVDATGAEWRAARAGDTLRLGEVSLAVLHPSDAWLTAHPQPNENSLVIALRYRGFDALFTGDIGWPAESALVRDMQQMEVLKVGHHGSAGSTAEPWLRRLGPAVAVISVGRGNRYGHPAPAVLQRLRSAGVRVRRTDQGGTVTITTNGSYFWIAQDGPSTPGERARCLTESWLRSSGSSSSRRNCTAAPPESFPIFSTTSPSPPR
jgi:competence protein ComEC